MKLLAILVGFGLFVGISNAQAQYASQKKAENLAIVKAVASYKINDEEHLNDVEALRQNRNFNVRLQKMLNKLSNTRAKNSTNRQVLKILEKAGNDIGKLLD